MAGNQKKRKKNAPRKQKRYLHLYIPFWIILGVFFGCVVFMQFLNYDNFSKDERRISLEIDKEDRITEELNRELKYYESDAYIEKIAREKLDLVMPDETIFFNVAGD